MITRGDRFIMTTEDKNSITFKTKTNKLLVKLDTPFNIGMLCIFMYNINDIPNPENVNVPGIAMYPSKIIRTDDNKYLVTDEVSRKFILEEVNYDV